MHNASSEIDVGHESHLSIALYASFCLRKKVVIFL